MGRRSSKARRSPKARPQGILEVTPRGFGFVKTAEGEYFIPSSKMNGAFPGDLVEVSRISNRREPGLAQVVEGQRQRPTGRVACVIMREKRNVIGRYEVADPFGVVVPDDPAIQYDIFTLRKDSFWVSDGDIVEVEIIEYPSRYQAATGRVVCVVSKEEDPSLEIDRILSRLGVPSSFPDAALEESLACKEDINLALSKGYRDLSDKFVYTIDPVDAKDFDDAVSCCFEDGLFHLGVYIADVSAYVPYGSSLDLEARKRATSVYLVDRVVPMLPERISNNLCSLVPGKRRQVLAVEATLTGDGTVRSYEVFPAVIRSDARLSYEQALALMSCDDSSAVAELRSAWSSCDVPQGALSVSDEILLSLRASLAFLSRLSQALFSRRYQAGCMDFERTEAKVVLDKRLAPVGLRLRKRTKATQAIEESMILANSLVAEWLVARELPCVFRVHDEPDGENLYELYQILSEMPRYEGLDEWGFCSGEPAVLQEVLRRSRGTDEHELVSLLLLRSMKRALYSVEDRPHFGVALEHYCHFTSPIRRYPDLLVHRLVKVAFFGAGEETSALVHGLPLMAEHSSKMERVAEKAAYESQQLKLVEYLQKDIGREFDGVISGVSTFGVFVRLENTAVGHVALGDLGDEHFSFDPDRYVLTGVDTGVRYRLGDVLRVVLTGCDIRTRRLSFHLVQGSD